VQKWPQIDQNQRLEPIENAQKWPQIDQNQRL